MHLDLENASREELQNLVIQLLARLQVLEERLQQVEEENHRLRQQTDKKPPPPFVKANRPKRQKPRAKRAQGFARRRDPVTRRVHHALSHCPQCQQALTGGRVRARRRVIELPAMQVEVIEHLVMERHCRQCQQAVAPTVDFSALVVGQQRFGISVQSEVAVLREQYRLPYRKIQDYLWRRFGLGVSTGEVVSMVQQMARLGKAEYQRLHEQIRGSPVVNGDETGWREAGQNGYLWSFSTPQTQYFLYRQTRAQTVVQEVLGEEFTGVLVSDFYGGYNAHRGLHQRCWAHLLRDIHALKQEHAKDRQVVRWAKAVKRIYERAKAYRGPQPEREAGEQPAERLSKQRQFEQELWALCRPHAQRAAPMSVLCRRIEKHLPELFQFVADERVPADNNGAERSLREPVVSRKISGGTRSAKGSETKSVLASLFGTWRLRGLDLYESCRKVLISQKSLV